ncbi:MAG: AbiV family abortive infection protein [Candidatus Bathyarchaeota archaeon]|nr:AbiV family abortive infection protein [Candidatus Bathyarchaeota archaeon]
MTRKQEFTSIPTAKVQEGIDLCRRNIAIFLDDAKALMRNGSLQNAYVLVQFGLEEFGKIIALKEAVENCDSGNISVNNKIFKNHEFKTEKAWTKISPWARIINEGFDEDVSDMPYGFPAYSEPTTEASPQTRLDCVFVDFREGNWINGHKIDRERLVHLITYIEHMLETLYPSEKGITLDELVAQKGET